MSNLSESEKQYDGLKQRLHEKEAHFALNFILDGAGVDDGGDYIWALGKDSAMFSHAEAVVFRIRKRLWGKKSYQFGLFPQGKDHEVFAETGGMAPVPTLASGLSNLGLYPCPPKYASAVKEWIKTEKEST
jgi:hypothetical protein